MESGSENQNNVASERQAQAEDDETSDDISKRRLNSDVWVDFDMLPLGPDKKQRCKCMKCGTTYACPSSYGTDIKKRTRGEFESDCESIGDNFKCFLKHEIVLKMAVYVWTDERLKVLVTTFYEHVHSQNTRYPHHQLLNILKERLSGLSDKEAKDIPLEDDISKKLTDLATYYEYKGFSYSDVKERLGKDTCKLYRSLVRNPRFNEYLPSGAKPTCVTDSVQISSASFSDHFFWTDKRLQSLVSTYYLCLQGLDTTETNGKKCLADLKKRLRWKITIKDLKSKLDKIFSDFEDLRNDYRAFRIRIGEETRCFFDCLVQRSDRKLYDKIDMTSSSAGSSSSKRSCRMSLADIKNAEHKVEMEQVASELAYLGLSEAQCGRAMCRLTDSDKRTSFWACSNREIRRYCVLDLVGDG